MRRYGFLTKESVYGALNKLRAAFLAAEDGNDVEEIIKSVLTFDERMKVGRRIQVAQMLGRGLTYDAISKELKVGLATINFVERSLREHRRAFDMIEKREEKVEESYRDGSYRKVGGSRTVFKRTEYTGLKRKDVPR